MSESETSAGVHFPREGDGRPTTATMEAVSPDADFSYDFQDLRLERVSA